MLAALVVLASATLYTNTESVTDVREHDGAIWVTTSGGLERYDATTLARTAVTATPPSAPSAPSVSPRYQGARETVRVATSAGVVVGTAGAGAWIDGPTPRRLTPTGQICGNHVVALVEWKGKTWAATFDRGVCWLDGDRWVTPTTDFRMTNDLIVTKKGLVVAASEGLFVTTDGVGFARWVGVDEVGFNDLALDGDVLYATMPGALWRVPLTRKAGTKPTARWVPGGSHAMQAVAVGDGAVWVTSEDRGVLRLDRDRKKRDVVVNDRAAGLPTSWHIDVAITGGTTWVATLRHGLLARDHGGAWRRVAGLESAWLLFVGADASQRGVWVGAQGGLYHVDEHGTVTDEGALLPQPDVHVVADRGAELWVGTEGGLVRVRR